MKALSHSIHYNDRYSGYATIPYPYRQIPTSFQIQSPNHEYPIKQCRISQRNSQDLIFYQASPRQDTQGSANVVVSEKKALGSNERRSHGYDTNSYVADHNYSVIKLQPLSTEGKPGRLRVESVLSKDKKEVESENLK